jgi:hypothetical protein
MKPITMVEKGEERIREENNEPSKTSPKRKQLIVLSQ